MDHCHKLATSLPKAYPYLRSICNTAGNMPVDGARRSLIEGDTCITTMGCTVSFVSCGTSCTSGTLPAAATSSRERAWCLCGNLAAVQCIAQALVIALLWKAVSGKLSMAAVRGPHEHHRCSGQQRYRSIGINSPASLCVPGGPLKRCAAKRRRRYTPHTPQKQDTASPSTMATPMKATLLLNCIGHSEGATADVYQSHLHMPQMQDALEPCPLAASPTALPSLCIQPAQHPTHWPTLTWKPNCAPAKLPGVLLLPSPPLGLAAGAAAGEGAPPVALATTVGGGSGGSSGCCAVAAAAGAALAAPPCSNWRAVRHPALRCIERAFPSPPCVPAFVGGSSLSHTHLTCIMPL